MIRSIENLYKMPYAPLTFLSPYSNLIQINLIDNPII